MHSSLRQSRGYEKHNMLSVEFRVLAGDASLFGSTVGGLEVPNRNFQRNKPQKNDTLTLTEYAPLCTTKRIHVVNPDNLYTAAACHLCSRISFEAFWAREQIPNEGCINRTTASSVAMLHHLTIQSSYEKITRIWIPSYPSRIHSFRHNHKPNSVRPQRGLLCLL